MQGACGSGIDGHAGIGSAVPSADYQDPVMCVLHVSVALAADSFGLVQVMDSWMGHVKGMGVGAATEMLKQISGACEEEWLLSLVEDKGGFCVTRQLLDSCAAVHALQHKWAHLVRVGMPRTCKRLFAVSHKTHTQDICSWQAYIHPSCLAPAQEVHSLLCHIPLRLSTQNCCLTRASGTHMPRSVLLPRGCTRF